MGNGGLVSELVGTLSPVNHKGFLHQGWKQTSIHSVWERDSVSCPSPSPSLPHPTDTSWINESCAPLLPPTSRIQLAQGKLNWLFVFLLLYLAWKRGLPRKFARFVLFRLLKKRSFSLLCVLDLLWLVGLVWHKSQSGKTVRAKTAAPASQSMEQALKAMHASTKGKQVQGKTLKQIKTLKWI